tara:strand:+ start:100 stop:282 length:183 start_codon:yes stop_codon:yes gene_type:complete
MKYEYKVLRISHKASFLQKDEVLERPTNELNKLAKEGWELVETFSETPASGIYILKRPLK